MSRILIKQIPKRPFMGIGGLRGGKVGADGKMHYNPGWEPGSMKTLVAHGLAGGIVQDRMGGFEKGPFAYKAIASRTACLLPSKLPSGPIFSI
jgi:hypothetical protein